MNQDSPTAFITGASSGIGAAFAVALAKRGYDLILTARREKLLAGLCRRLEEEYGINGDYVLAELSDLDETKKLEELVRRTENLRMVVNNAGYTRLEPFHKDSPDAQVEMITVHDVASVRLAHAAIPGMLEMGRGTIINVSSIAAFQIGARNLMYDATKAFLLNFSESLHLELKGSGIKVQALCPGFTRTDFHAKLGYSDDDPIFDEKPFMSAQRVVEASLSCLRRGKVVCIPGLGNKLRAFITSHMPRRLFYKLYSARARKK